MTSAAFTSSLLGSFPVVTSTRNCDLGKEWNKFCCFNEKKEQRNVICACMAPPTRNLGRDEFHGTKFTVIISAFFFFCFLALSLFNLEGFLWKFI